MRLRRETGDFSIHFSSDVTEVTIRPNLTPEDLIGVVISYPAGLTGVLGVAVVNNAYYDDGAETPAVMLTAGSSSYSYDPATGAVVVAG